MLDHPVRFHDGEVMITVGDFCMDVGRHGGESLDCPLRRVGDIVASDEEQRRNG